jgi:hypothetical protein
MENVVALVRAYAECHGYTVRVHRDGENWYVYMSKGNEHIAVSLNKLTNLIMV